MPVEGLGGIGAAYVPQGIRTSGRRSHIRPYLSSSPGLHMRVAHRTPQAIGQAVRRFFRTSSTRATALLIAATSLAAPMIGPAQAMAQDTAFGWTLPWDDASAATPDLSGWNRPIESDADRLIAGTDGHLYRGTERVRLFGFNITAGAQFPDRESAEKVAARLAKFGVNYVRIAQNSNLAPDGWLDRTTASTLDAEALGRLDYFIAQLRRRGIYVHLVLTQARRVYPADVPGFEPPRRGPVPEGWPNPPTGITQFFTPVIESNRNLARLILSHQNPYTGLTYAQDPTIAIVEVTNEDGLARIWRTGELDPIIDARSPHLRPLRAELQARWNHWLLRRYPSDAELRTAWGEGAPTGATPLLINGDFRQGTQAWQLYVRTGAQARYQVVPGVGPSENLPALQVSVGRAGSEGWHVMVQQDRVRVRAGQPYRIAFWARAERSGTKISVNLQQAQPPNRILVPRTTDVVLGDRWEQHEFVTETVASESNALLNFIVGYNAQTLWLAAVTLQEAPATGLRESESATAGTVPPFLQQDVGLRTLAAQRDWIAFLYDTEEAFFAEMRRLLSEELQVRSLLAGSQNSYSFPTIQTMFDLNLMHRYWSHPTFPGRPWDPDNWLVRNRSMTNAGREWNTLNEIAFYRVLGKPLLVDEYNHPQPNTFGAEGLPLIGTYAAFQDWDGIAGWSYFSSWQGRFPTADDWARSALRPEWFSMDSDPVKMLSAWLAAVVFRRGDVAPSVQTTAIPLTADLEREVARTRGLWRLHESVGAESTVRPFRQRVGLRIGPPAPQGERLPTAEQGAIVTDTAQVTWDTRRAGRGVVTANTPRTRMVIGFGGGMEFTLSDVTIRPGPTAQQGFGVWAVTAMDGTMPIARARRLIIVALGYAQNTGMRWRIYPNQALPGLPPEGSSITVGREWGGPPVMVEGVPARVSLPPSAGQVQAWALDERGQRKRPLEVRLEGGRPVVEIGPAYKTLWYEVEVGSR